MASILAAINGASQLIPGERETAIDDLTFRLFYQYTPSILLISSFLVSSSQFFGSPIQCDLVGSMHSISISIPVLARRWC